jgi:flagellar biosynthesis/type III secretory pathway M-ring protein FliF/YscJ
MTEQFGMLAEIGNWPFYWPIIALCVLIGIALILYEIVDRFLAQRRGELSNKLQWDAGYIERISKAFKNKETDNDQKIPTNDRAEARFEEQTKVEKMGMF